MTTYNITIDSCEATPKLVATFEDVPKNQLELIVSIATQTFRSVEIVNNETGEVVLTHYVGTEMHKSLYNYGEAIDLIRFYAYNYE